VSDATPVSIRVPLPYDIVRGVATTLTAATERGDVAVTATDATCTIYDAGGTQRAQYTSAVSGGVATANVGASDLTSFAYDDGWRVEWSITTAEGIHTSRHEAALCRAGLYPVITGADLYQLYQGLDSTADSGIAITTRTDWQTKIDEAWVQVVLRLRGLGRRHYLIMSPSSLRLAHLHLSLSLIFADLAMSHAGSDFLGLSAKHQADYDAAWNQLNFVYDADDDGEPDAGRTGGPSTLWLGC
jgi:hypothetical protein